MAKKALLVAGTTGLLLTLTLTMQSANADVVVGYQTGADPTKVAIANGDYEKAIGEKVVWKRFNSGPAILAALASKSIDIAYVGSTPVASAISQGLPLSVFLVNTLNNTNEELVARNSSGITSPQSLVGKTIATTFVSTSHYSLLNALHHWGIANSKVKLVNLDPANIAAAWKRGDIDAAFTWDPALSEIKQSGHVITSAGQVGKWGAPTLDVWTTLQSYANTHPKVLEAFTAATLQSFSNYYQHQNEWTAQSPQITDISKLTGASPNDIPQQLKAGHYPDLAEQASPSLLGGGVAHALKSTAEFLYQQKSIPQVKHDYSAYVTTRYLPAKTESTTQPEK